MGRKKKTVELDREKDIAMRAENAAERERLMQAEPNKPPAPAQRGGQRGGPPAGTTTPPSTGNR